MKIASDPLHLSLAQQLVGAFRQLSMWRVVITSEPSKNGHDVLNPLNGSPPGTR